MEYRSENGPLLKTAQLKRQQNNLINTCSIFNITVSDYLHLWLRLSPHNLCIFCLRLSVPFHNALAVGNGRPFLDKYVSRNEEIGNLSYLNIVDNTLVRKIPTTRSGQLLWTDGTGVRRPKNGIFTNRTRSDHSFTAVF